MKIILKQEIQAPFKEGLIKARGIENIKRFLSPTVSNLLDPYLLENIDEGLDLLLSMQEGRCLGVVDPDVDGFCSLSILYQVMKEINPEWDIDTILHEEKQHGLEDIVERLDIGQYDLVLLPDAGSNDDKYFLNYPGTKFLVIDHHLRETEDAIPSNVVIINNQLSPKYSNKSLSGAGVVWQFTRALDNRLNTNVADKHIDLVAFSIISDVMDVSVLENRYIIDKGLQNINSPFLRMLINNASYSIGNRELTPMNVAFYVAPNINAVCRVGSMEEKENLLAAFITPSKLVPSKKRGVAPGTMVEVAIEATRESSNAKSRQRTRRDKMSALCEQKIIEQDLLKNKILVLELDEDFDGIPRTLNGLAASILAEKYGRPVLLGRTNDEGELKGSIRGLPILDMPPLKSFLESSNLFDYVEGHQLAAGFSIAKKNLDKFYAYVEQELSDLQIGESTWEVDFLVDPHGSELRTLVSDMDDLRQFWGHGFPEALIGVEEVEVPRGNINVMGKYADTVKIFINGITYMFFKQSKEQVKTFIDSAYIKLKLVGKCELNIYNGRRSPQILVKDYEILGQYDASTDF